MTRSRSRNYPSLSLGEAIERARTLYKQEGRAAAPADVVVRAWGYNSLNGASLRVLSALRQYGLLEGSNDGMKLSGRALTILLEPETHPDYAEALHEALQAPALFQDIVQEYATDLPSDPALISYLVRKQNFGEAAARTLIAAFRESAELVRNKTTGYITDDEAVNALTTSPSNMPVKPLLQRELEPRAVRPTREFTFPLSDDTVIALGITGPMPTKDDMEAITDWLKLVERQISRSVTSQSLALTTTSHESSRE